MSENVDTDSVGYYSSIGTALPTRSGITPSERMVASIATSSFFSLWCYSGLFNDEGISKRKQGTELCDLLVVFQNHVIIFSDKSIAYSSSKPAEIAWPRWYKRAVVESAHQVLGAENWIRRFPHRIYLDPACKVRFPIELPSGENARYHRVLVASDSFLLAKNFFGRGSSGSFMIIPSLSPEEAAQKPFCIGQVVSGKGVFHVLNEYSLSILVQELGTLPDFISYLCAKEELIESKLLALAAGEEEMLAHYFQLGGNSKQASSMMKATRKLVARGRGDAISLAEGLWEEFKASSFYSSMERLRVQAGPWNYLVEDIAEHIVSGRALGPSREVSAHERVVRFFSAEPLISRALLSTALLEKLDSVPEHHRSARLVPSPTQADLVFILVIFPPDEGGQDQGLYRREREAVGYGYALVAKLKYPQYMQFAILLTQKDSAEGTSRDFVVFEIEGLSDKDKTEAMRLRDEEHILSDVTPITGLEISNRMADRRGEVFRAPYAESVRNTRVGRNDPCPCGSGKKFKRCHGG